MHSSPRPILFFSLAAVFIAYLAGCGDSSTPGPLPDSGHMYVGTSDTPARLLQFGLPISSTSSPTANLANNTLGPTAAVAVDANGNVATADFSGNLAVFTGPISGSTPAPATFKNGTATNTGQLAFNNAGDLFATTVSGTVNLFTHPLTSASTPSQVISNVNLTKTVGAAVDSSGNLFISNTTGSASNLVVLAPPYNGLPIVTRNVPAASYHQMAVSSNQLFVVSSVVGASRVDVYNLPINAGSAPAFAIISGISNAPRDPQSVALDASGNLYVMDVSNGTVNVYRPPFSSSSAPVVTLAISFGSAGMAVGK